MKPLIERRKINRDFEIRVEKNLSELNINVLYIRDKVDKIPKCEKESHQKQLDLHMGLIIVLLVAAVGAAIKLILGV